MAQSGSMIGGLLQGFTGVALQKQQQKHEEELEDKRSKLAILTQIDPSALDSNSQQTLAQMLDDTLGTKKKDAPYQQLFKKVAPLFEHFSNKRKQAGTNYTPTPASRDELQQVSPETTNTTSLPAPPSPSGTGNVPMAPGVGTAKLAAPPSPDSSTPSVSRNVPQVPRGTQHPPAPTSVGGLWTSQQDPMARRQAQADEFQRRWEEKNGPLTPDQKAQLGGWVLGDVGPYGFGSAGRRSAQAHKTGEPILGGSINDSTVDAEGNPLDPKKTYQPYQLGNGERQYWEVTPKAQKLSGPQAKFQEQVDEYLKSKGWGEDKRQQAEQQIATENRALSIGKLIAQGTQNQLRKEEIARLSDELANGNMTVKSSRVLLQSVKGEAAKRAAQAAKEAATGFPSTGGQPGPDYGKSQDDIADEILESQGFVPDDVKNWAYKNAGGGIRNRTGNTPKPPAGGTGWGAFPPAQ